LALENVTLPQQQGSTSNRGHRLTLTFDPQAQQVVHEAATFAKAHPLTPLSIKNTTPDMGLQVDTLSGQRTEAVLHALLQEGVSRMRIEIVGADRLLDPNGMPNLPPQRVDISVGF